MKHLVTPSCIQRHADVAKKPVWLGGLFNSGDTTGKIERWCLGADAVEQILSRRITRLVLLLSVSYRQASQVDGSLVSEENGHPLAVLESRKPVVEVVGRRNPHSAWRTSRKESCCGFVHEA